MAARLREFAWGCLRFANHLEGEDPALLAARSMAIEIAPLRTRRQYKAETILRRLEHQFPRRHRAELAEIKEQALQEILG